MGRFFHDRGYSLSKRGRFFYAQFWNPDTKRYTTAKSTRETTEAKALAFLRSVVMASIISMFMVQYR